MKKVFGLTVCLLFVWFDSGRGQYLNLQHHFDFGKDRHYFTNTLEGLGVDSWGAWFGFIDVDHKSLRSGTANHDWQIGTQLIYFELNRYFALGKLLRISGLKSWDFTLQYNDSDADFIPYAFLAGLSWNRLFAPGLDSHLEFLLRQEEGQKLGWQLTFVWFKEWQCCGETCQWLGYFDWWQNDAGCFLMAEPQLVANLKFLGLGKRFWLGTEWEINLAAASEKNSVNPTLFLRYDF